MTPSGHDVACAPTGRTGDGETDRPSTAVVEGLLSPHVRYRPPVRIRAEAGGGDHRSANPSGQVVQRLLHEVVAVAKVVPEKCLGDAGALGNTGQCRVRVAPTGQEFRGRTEDLRTSLIRAQTPAFR